MSAKRKLWLAGLVVAAIGVVLVRVVAPRYEPPELKVAVFGLGVIIAIAGLGIIMYGLRKSAK